MEPAVNLFGPVDAVLGPYIAEVLLVLVVANMGARAAEYRQITEQAADGADAIRRHTGRVATNVLLVVGAFYYMSLHHHGGLVFSVLVLGVFVADLFEFEARKVEARRDLPIEKPKGALAASVLALLYIAYQTLFFLVKPYWSAIV